MNFLCTTCHRVHGTEADELRACRDSLLTASPKDAMAAYHAAAARRATQGVTDAAKSAEGYVRARKAGCPDKELSVLLHRPQETAALDAAKRWNDNRAAWSLSLLGPPGIGKTVAACWLMVDFCRRWEWNAAATHTGRTFEPCMYLPISQLARLSLFDTAGKDKFAALQDTRLLVLEDAGDEATDFGTKELVELLMDRHRDSRRTVLCANLSGEALLKRYGEAVVSRLKNGVIPNLQGQKSLRKRSGA